MKCVISSLNAPQLTKEFIGNATEKAKEIINKRKMMGIDISYDYETLKKEYELHVFLKIFMKNEKNLIPFFDSSKDKSGMSRIVCFHLFHSFF